MHGVDGIKNKHAALQEWVQPFLDDKYLYFESADALPNIRVIEPSFGDYLTKTDICGFKYKSYTFLFVGYQQISHDTDDVNISNLSLFDEFNYWLEEKIEQRLYPDFGEKCSDYEIEILNNMARLTHVTPDGVARYVLGARINYKEE